MHVISTFILIFFVNFIQGALQTKHTGEEDWIDPFDMINYDSATKSMNKVPVKEVGKGEEAVNKALLQCQHQLKACHVERNHSAQACQIYTEKKKAVSQESCTQSELYIRRFVNILLRASRLTEDMPLNLDTTLRISVTPEQLQVLQKFSRGGDDVSMQQLEGVLSSVLLSASISLYSPDSVLLTTIKDFLFCREMLLALVLGALPVYATWKILNGHSLMQVLIIFFTGVFMVSYSVTYCRMYKQEEIRQYSLLKKDPHGPAECRPPTDLTWFETIQRLLSSQLSISSDECQKYYETVMMDPLLKVTPTVVLSEMLSGFILHPSGMLGTAIAQFSGGILGNLPFGTNYIVLLISFLLLAVLMVTACGGAIKLPYYLGGGELSGRIRERRPPERITQKQEGTQQDSLNHLLKAVETSESGLIITNIRGLQLLSSTKPMEIEEKIHVPGCCGESKTSCQHDKSISMKELSVTKISVSEQSPTKPKKNQTEVQMKKAVAALDEALQDSVCESSVVVSSVTAVSATHSSVQELTPVASDTCSSEEELMPCEGPDSDEEGSFVSI